MNIEHHSEHQLTDNEKVEFFIELNYLCLAKMQGAAKVVSKHWNGYGEIGCTRCAIVHPITLSDIPLYINICM